MANETAVLTWLKSNITSFTPASPAQTITSAYIYPDDYISFAPNATNPAAPHIQIWREPQFHEYATANLGTFVNETWRAGVFVMIADELIDIWSQDGQTAAQRGYAYRDALIAWLKNNEKLDGNRVLGEGATKYFIDPFTPAPPWAMCDGWGTYLVLPIQDLR